MRLEVNSVARARLGWCASSRPSVLFWCHFYLSKIFSCATAVPPDVRKRLVLPSRLPSDYWGCAPLGHSRLLSGIDTAQQFERELPQATLVRMERAPGSMGL